MASSDTRPLGLQEVCSPPLAEADAWNPFLDLGITSRALYSAFSRELLETTGIDIEYRCEGTLFLSISEDDDEELERRWSWQDAAGLNVERVDRTTALEMSPLVTEQVRWALRFPDDHQVENRRLVTALKAAAQAAGAFITEHSEVRSLLIDGQRVSGVKTLKGEVYAAAVVIAAGSWSSLIARNEAPFSAKMGVHPVRGQMLALAAPPSGAQSVVYSRRGYLIPRFNGSLLAGSTIEHAGYDKRVTVGGISSIIQNALELMPCVKDLTIIDAWAGLRPATSDGWPVIGPDPQLGGLFYATGHYRNGILLTPITARIICNLLVQAEAGRDLTPFSVTRFAHRAAAG